MSAPYSVTVDFYTEDGNFTVDTCMRQQLTLEVVDGDGNKRFFDGVVDSAEYTDVIRERIFFRLRLRPAMAALAHRFNCRIFQDLNVLAIAQTIFDESGFGEKVETLTTKEYPSRDYIVQYRESELNFVTRLFEEHGIFYWFGHRSDGHTLLFTDDSAQCSVQDDTPMASFTMTEGTAVPGMQPLLEFRRTRRLRTNGVQLRDYNFEKPQAPPEGNQPGEDAWPAPYFEYPGGFTDSAGGELLANARMRTLRHDADTVAGKSNAIGMRVGVPFTVDGAGQADLNGAFIVTELISRGQQFIFDRSFACENEFKGIVKDAPYGSPARARKPYIHGVQTAIVTGSSEQAQALHVDKYGRIKVRFYWDRVGQQDDTSSCWLRVSQLGLGGSMILPRIGWEVPVTFLNGDPNRPMVLGRVYNGEKPPPCALPAANATGSLKSWSSPGGGGYNELSMSDTGGSQGFNLHAQKDLNITIGNDKNETVAVDESHMVSVNESHSVGVDESIEVGANQTVSVGANLTCNVGGNQSITVSGNDTSNATCDYVEKIDVDRTYEISGNQFTIENGIRYEVTGDLTKEIGSVQINASIASIKETVQGSYTHNSSLVTVHLIKGNHGETIAKSKSQTSIAAELHKSSANIEQTCDAAVTNLVGGLHYQKLAGDLVIKAPIVSMLGAVGSFKGGGSELKLGGGPVVAKGKKIAIKAGLIVKMSGSLKMGS